MGTNAYFTYSVVGFRGTVSAFLLHRPANSYNTTPMPHPFGKHFRAMYRMSQLSQLLQLKEQSSLSLPLRDCVTRLFD